MRVPKVVRIVMALLLVMAGTPVGLDAQLNRVSAQFKNFDATESTTTLGAAAGGAGGLIIYNKSFLIASLASLGEPELNTVFVTISTTGDTHGGRALLLACLLNGAPCNPGTGGAGAAPTGWINLQKHFDTNTAYGPGVVVGDGGGGGGDMHDNNIYYRWCSSKLKIGFNNVKIKLAALPAGDSVFVEAVHVYIDVATVPGGCIPGAP